MSIQKPLDARDERYLKLVLGRMYGKDELEIVQELADFDSPQQLYERIKEDGHPICPKCGTTYVDETHCETQTDGAGHERLSRGRGGEVEELPAAANASTLFEYAIDRLKADLNYATHLRETLQDGRFEAEYVYPKEEGGRFPKIYIREQVSPERWEELCTEQGKDPASTDTLYVSEEDRLLGGTSPWPAMPLVRLVTAYLLYARSSHEVEMLVERLHPKSREPNVEQINKYLTGRADGLLPITKKLATVIRGKTIKRGQNAVGDGLSKHRAGDFMRRARQQGIAEEEIMRVMHEDFQLSESEITRLEGLFSPHRQKE